MHKITLKPGKSKPFWNREPLVFSGAIAKVEGNPAAAELVSLYDDAGFCIGWGVFNPHSLYRVRMLALSSENLSPHLETLLQHRLGQAVQKRAQLGLPASSNTAYRLVNSEADGLSGLTVDVFDQVAVVSSTAYWVEFYKVLIQKHIQEALKIESLVWRQQSKALTQDGWTERDPIQKDSHCVSMQENDLTYSVDLGQGQKTGFYCDQRENRLILRSVVKNKKVLDCFCYTGGFALNAAKGGAKSVVGIDSSKPALALAQKNAELNRLSNVQFEDHDVMEFLKTAEGFDCIVLDPPKLAPTQKSLVRAKHYYTKLNILALSKLSVGGHLMTFSCSDAVDAKLFLSLVRKAAEKAEKSIKVIKTLSAGADHPFLEKSQYGNYLKGLLVEVIANP